MTKPRSALASAHIFLNPTLCSCLLLFLLICGCRSLPRELRRPPNQTARKSPPPGLRDQTQIITNTPQRHFSLSQKLNPVWWYANVDDPVPPPWYRPGQRSRQFRWHLRNPFHNFTFYVIGIADKPFTRVGRYPGAIENPHGGLNWAMCRYRAVRLPFVAVNEGRLQFYCGWRRGGNFGIKLNFGGRSKTRQTRDLESPPTPRASK